MSDSAHVLGSYERFRLTTPEPGVLVVTMSRPEKLNALDQLWFAELTRLMRAVGKDGDDHRAVVLTGGERPALAVQVGKAFVNRGTETGYPESVEAVALLFGTDEHRAAVAAFRARRS